MSKKIGRVLLGLLALIAATIFLLAVNYYADVAGPAAAAKARVRLIDDPQKGRLVLDTVGGDMKDINIVFQNWVRKHPRHVTTNYQLVVHYARRDSLRVGEKER